MREAESKKIILCVSIIAQGFTCIHAWMLCRDSTAYQAVLQPLVDVMEPERIYCDFEERLHNAAERLFPTATVKGSYASYCTVSSI